MSATIWETKNLARIYCNIKKQVIQLGFAEEIRWQASVRLDDLTEQKFLQEYAWVVLACGMKEKIVRQKWPEIMKAFGGFKSAGDIADPRNSVEYVEAALKVFNHSKKIKAIFRTAEHIAEFGWDWHLKEIKSRQLEMLDGYEFIGPITKYHLGKNIGLQVAKPDRHLIRIARACGYKQVRADEAVQALSRDISENTGDSIPVVDIVLWRYATQVPDYIVAFKSGGVTE